MNPWLSFMIRLSGSVKLRCPDRAACQSTSVCDRSYSDPVLVPTPLELPPLKPPWLVESFPDAAVYPLPNLAIRLPSYPVRITDPPHDPAVQLLRTTDRFPPSVDFPPSSSFRNSCFHACSRSPVSWSHPSPHAPTSPSLPSDTISVLVQTAPLSP